LHPEHFTSHLSPARSPRALDKRRLSVLHAHMFEKCGATKAGRFTNGPSFALFPHLFATFSPLSVCMLVERASRTHLER
jgi:hypothetical protein